VGALLAASDAYEAGKTSGADLNALGAVLSAAKGTLCGLFATACAQRDPRFGQRRKESGTNFRRADGVLVSTDVLMWKDDGQIIDTLSDRGYGWSINPADHQPVDQWVAALPADAGVPVPGTPLPPEPPPVASLDAIVRALIADAVAPLRAEIEVLKTRPQPTGGSFPTRIALRTDNGHYLCAEDGGGQAVNATRDAVAAWETFTVEPQP